MTRFPRPSTSARHSNVMPGLLPALELLANTIETRAAALDDAVKTGRTHLMDAMPVTLGQELRGWAQQTRNGMARIESALPRLYKLAQGGTAVGTGINAHPEFAARIAAVLSRENRPAAGAQR